jgi:hypothetical protein
MGGTGMGQGGARYVYWLFIVIGSVLLVGRDIAFELLKIVFCIGLPIAVSCSTRSLQFMLTPRSRSQSS